MTLETARTTETATSSEDPTGAEAATSADAAMSAEPTARVSTPDLAQVLALHVPDFRCEPTPPAGPIEPVVSFPLGIDRDADWHTHSDLSIGTGSALSLADAAQAAGLRKLGITDRITADREWLVEYTELVRAFARPGLTVMCGVETTVLDSAGRLDLPREMPFLDYAIVTVVDLPWRAGLMLLAEVQEQLADGELTGEQVVEALVAATAAAVRSCPARPVVGRLFSPLLQVGLSLDLVTPAHLATVAAACRDAGGAVEVNERWSAPSAAIATALVAAGVTLVAGSSAMTPDAVGRWNYLDQITGTESSDLAEVVDIESYARVGADDSAGDLAELEGSRAADLPEVAVTA